MHAPSIEVFYDGDCPLCRREIAFLRKRDRQERVRFTDIARPDFDPADTGRTVAQLMERIQGRRLPGGEMLEGVEVFRGLYEAVGFRVLVTISRLPGLAWLLDRLYGVFARNRLRLTGRCDIRGCKTHAPAPPASAIPPAPGARLT